MSEPPLDDGALAALERDIGLTGSLYSFARMVWPLVPRAQQPFLDNWHIGLKCELLEAVHAGEIENLILNEPPGCGKSIIVQVIWPIWSWLRDPTLGFLSTSFDLDLTRGDADRALQIIQSEWFVNRFADRVWVASDAAAGHYSNAKGGWRFATSTGGKATGRHPNRKIIDDPTKPKTVSEKTLKDAANYWRNTLVSRGIAGVVRTVLIMQRLAENDLAGVLEAGGDFHVCKLPMRYSSRIAYPKDPRTKEGELLFPALFPEKAVAHLEKNMGPTTAAAQLGQEPFPEGGAIIKKEWIQWYEPGALPADIVQKVQSWDLTFKNTEDAHYVAGQLWGVAGPNFYFIDGVLEKMDFVESIKAILAMRNANPDAIGILIEDKANGPAVMSMLESSVSGIVPVEPLGGKAARLIAVQPLFAAKNVWLPKGHPIAEQLARSLVAFPKGSIDDDVDACTQALNHLHGGVIDYEAAMAGGGF